MVCWLKEIGEQFNYDELSPEFQRALDTDYKNHLTLREQVRVGMLNLRQLSKGDEFYFQYDMENSYLSHSETDEIEGNFTNMGNAIAAAQDGSSTNWVAEAGFYLMATWNGGDVTNEKSQFPEDDPNPFIYSPPAWLVLGYYDGDKGRTFDGTDSWLVSFVHLEDDTTDPFITSGWDYSQWEPDSGYSKPSRSPSVSKIYYLGTSCSEGGFKKNFPKTGIINWLG
jgi:hypothetical protein